jgi:ubiquinone/menaquinone biosynthesis C-methylase UbiE
MTLKVDPARNELRALKRVTSWRGKQVLEVGCGDGRLTQRLASLGAAKIIALDPDAKLIRIARQNVAERFAHRISFRVGHAERLSFRANSFDRVVFSWVL